FHSSPAKSRGDLRGPLSDVAAKIENADPLFLRQIRAKRETEKLSDVFGLIEEEPRFLSPHEIDPENERIVPSGRGANEDFLDVSVHLPEHFRFFDRNPFELSVGNIVSKDDRVGGSVVLTSDPIDRLEKIRQKPVDTG